MSNILPEIKNVSKSHHRTGSFSMAFHRSQELQMRFAALALVLPLIFASFLKAQEVSHLPANWSGSLGGAVIASPKYLGSDEYRLLPMPLLSVEYKGRIFLDPTSSGLDGALGVYVIRTRSWDWAMIMGVSEARSESRADALAGMGNHGAGFNGGASASFRHGMFQTSGRVVRGFNDDAGWTGTLSAGLGSQLSRRWFAKLDANATFADAKQMQYLFGINASQARRRQALIAAGDPRLRPDEGGAHYADAGLQSVGFSGSAGYILSRRWLALGYLSINRLHGDAAGSPLVRQRNSLVTGLGLSYRW